MARHGARVYLAQDKRGSEVFFVYQTVKPNDSYVLEHNDAEESSYEVINLGDDALLGTAVRLACHGELSDGQP